MQRDGSLRDWSMRLESFRRSGLGVREWCQQQGISANQYYYWRRRLSQALADQSANPQWLAVEAVESAGPHPCHGGILLHIAGATIELEPGFDAHLLRAVVSALAVAPC